MAISLPLSSIWIWYYILEQYDTDLFQSYVGYVISAITFSLGVGVMRYAPGGEGPMDLYMVVSLVWLRSLKVSQDFSTPLQLPSFCAHLRFPLHSMALPFLQHGWTQLRTSLLNYWNYSVCC